MPDAQAVVSTDLLDSLLHTDAEEVGAAAENDAKGRTSCSCARLTGV